MAAAVECPDLLVVNRQEMLLIGHALKVVDSAIVFEDEYGDEDRYPVYTVEPDPNTLLPYVDLPAEGLKRFAEEQDGRWMIVPKDGVTIDYQVNVRNGMLQLSAGIAELVQPLDEDASLEGISAVRRLYLSEAMVRALGIDSIDTGVLAQANNFTD